MFITVILIENDSNLIILFVQHSTRTGVKARTHGKVTLDEYQRLHECRETRQTTAMTCQAVTLGKGLMLGSMMRKQNTNRTNVLTARRHIDSDGKAISGFKCWVAGRLEEYTPHKHAGMQESWPTLVPAGPRCCAGALTGQAHIQHPQGKRALQPWQSMRRVTAFPQAQRRDSTVPELSTPGHFTQTMALKHMGQVICPRPDTVTALQG